MPVSALGLRPEWPSVLEQLARKHREHKTIADRMCTSSVAAPTLLWGSSQTKLAAIQPSVRCKHNIALAGSVPDFRLPVDP